MITNTVASAQRMRNILVPTLIGVTILQRTAMIPTPMGPTLVDVWVLLKDGLVYDVWVRAC